MFAVNFSIISQNRVAISDENDHDAHPSAMLELISNDKGFLLPRLETNDRDGIDSPAESLLIFNDETNCVEAFVGGEWNEVWCHEEIDPSACQYIGDPVTFEYPAGSGTDVTYYIIGGENGTCWLDRNLGAERVAESFDDSEAFGDLFQWGRLDDGHQDRDSGTTTDTSDDNEPGHSDFIVNDENPFSWIVPQTCDLWQSESCENNPCPPGWRIPTLAEWQAETASWSSDDYRIDAFNTMQLTSGGTRDHASGNIQTVVTGGYYWTSECTPDYYTTTPPHNGVFRQIILASMKSRLRNKIGEGQSVRCIMD